MPFEWFVALRYLRDGRAQTLLVMAAVSVGVSVVVFLSALIGGLQTSLVEKTLGSQPHVTVHVTEERARPLALADHARAVSRTVLKAPQRLRSLDQWPALQRDLEAVPGVTAASPSVLGAGFAERGSAKRPIVVRGVDPERFRAIVDIPARLVAGHYDLSGAHVVIGEGLAEDLGVTVGERVTVVTSEGVDDVVTIAGIFSLGNKGADGAWVLTSLRQAQALYALPGGITTLELKVADVFQAEVVAQEIGRRSPVTAESWMALNAELLSGLSAQNSSKYLIQFFVVVAVALGIASVLIVSVVQKSREIGILRAVGTPRSRILRVFLIQGGLLGLAGSFVGSAMGAGFSAFFERLLLDPSGAPKFRITLEPSLFLSASLLATVVGLASAVVPARRAASLDPSTAIRNG